MNNIPHHIPWNFLRFFQEPSGKKRKNIYEIFPGAKLSINIFCFLKEASDKISCRKNMDRIVTLKLFESVNPLCWLKFEYNSYRLKEVCVKEGSKKQKFMQIIDRTTYIPSTETFTFLNEYHDIQLHYGKHMKYEWHGDSSFPNSEIVIM